MKPLRRILAVLSLLSGCSSGPAGEFHGVVAAASPEAASAGARILTVGGNAMDAAVAVAFALGVTEPAMSGLGGQTQIVFYRPGMDSALVLNGTSFAPAVIPAGVAREDLTGHRATTIPTTVKVLDHALRYHGSGNVSWREVLEPAIGYAEDGFVLGRFRHQVLRRHREHLRASTSAAPLFLNEDGSIPEEGAVWKQPLLAVTLRRLAEHGGDDFYNGAVAAVIAADMEAHGGWITAADLAELPPPLEQTALRGSYRGYDVWTLPHPGGGWAMLQMLAALEREPRDAIVPAVMARALREGHRARRDNDNPSGGETTHFSVVDASGMAVSVTASINAYYGARAANPELGFLYNDYMHEFVLDEPHNVFALTPRAKPYSSMTPTILSRDARPVLVLGSPGSARIISAVTQVVHHWVDEEMSIVAAVSEHRLHALPDGQLYAEGDALAEIEWAELERDGFRRTEPADDLVVSDWNAYFGGVHAIAFESGEWRGAADPRRDGVAIGVPRE